MIGLHAGDEVMLGSLILGLTRCLCITISVSSCTYECMLSVNKRRLYLSWTLVIFLIIVTTNHNASSMHDRGNANYCYMHTEQELFHFQVLHLVQRIVLHDDY